MLFIESFGVKKDGMDDSACETKEGEVEVPEDEIDSMEKEIDDKQQEK